MKLDADLYNAVIAFNISKSFDEFNITLDMIGWTIGEFSAKYYDAMHKYYSKSCDGILKKIFTKYLKWTGAESDVKRVFNRVISFAPNGKQYCTVLPVGIEIHRPELRIYYDNSRFVRVNYDLFDDIGAMHGIDIGYEFANSIMYELATENQNERKVDNAI